MLKPNFLEIIVIGYGYTNNNELVHLSMIGTILSILTILMYNLPIGIY